MSLDPKSDARPSRLRPGARIGAVVSTYHGDVTETMLASAREALEEAGLLPGDLIEVRVPGAFELPLVAKKLARRDDVDAVLCFGLVLKGETDHDRYIARAVSGGLMRSALEEETPILFGVLTCDSHEQAEVRARRAAEGGLDKGREVALAAVGVLAALAEVGEVKSPTGEAR